MGSSSENLKLLADEIEALAAIYEENFMLLGRNAFAIKICCKFGKEVLLNVTLPDGYPMQCPPIYEISAPWMSRESKLILNDEIQEVSGNNPGECIVYLWVITITDFIEKLADNDKQLYKVDEASGTTDIKESSDGLHMELCNLPNVEHGEPIIDKKSVFQSHLARITSEKQVALVLRKLKENKKIASATHNTYAYRISLPNGSVIEGVDDDGEKKAGAVLLRILQFSNLSDILIIVTRWYGGINLGADRFKDYSNAARNLINHLELIHSKNEDFKQSKAK